MFTRRTFSSILAKLLLVAFLIANRQLIAQGGGQAHAGVQQPATSPTRFSVRIAGAAAGVKPDVIFIPGLASSREVFSAEATLLGTNYRMHLVQIAGFAGESAGPNVAGPILVPVVEQLHHYIIDNHLRHPAIIGHSLGGLLAMMLADSHPSDVGDLLIIDSLPYYGLVFNPNATVATLRPQAVAMRDSLLAMTPQQFAASQPVFASRLVSSPLGLKTVVAGCLTSDRNVFANAMLEDLSTDLRPRLSSIKAHIKVLYPYSPAEGSQADVLALYTSAYSGKQDITFARIDDSLHFIMFDQPTAFHKNVVDFLETAARK